MKCRFLTSWIYRRAYGRLLNKIISKVNAAEEFWEIDYEMDMLWRLGDKGEFNALIVYCMILLQDDKAWYNPKEAMIMLETLAEEEYSAAQCLFGMLKFNGAKDIETDKISGLYWIRKAAEGGSPEAQAFIKMRSEGC